VNNAILLVTAFKEETVWVFVLRAVGISVRARVRPIFLPVSLTIFGMMPLAAEIWSQSSIEASNDLGCVRASGFNDAGIAGLAGAVRSSLRNGIGAEERDVADVCTPGSMWSVSSPATGMRISDLTAKFSSVALGDLSDERKLQVKVDARLVRMGMIDA